MAAHRQRVIHQSIGNAGNQITGGQFTHFAQAHHHRATGTFAGVKHHFGGFELSGILPQTHQLTESPTQTFIENPLGADNAIAVVMPDHNRVRYVFQIAVHDPHFNLRAHFFLGHYRVITQGSRL